MKKKILCGLILTIIFGVCITIPSISYCNQKKKSKRHLKEEQKIDVYMLEDDKIVGISAYVEALKEDIIAQKFACMTYQEGRFDKNYDTCIDKKTKLLSSKIDDDTLTLELTDDFLNSKGRKTIEQLVWTYCNDQIKELKFIVNGAYINELNGFSFKVASKDLGVNLTFNTSYLFEANVTTIINYFEDYLEPVTYFYTGVNPYQFMISKVLDENIATNYEVNEDTFKLIISKDIILNDLEKKSLEATILHNLQCTTLMIFCEEDLVYETC